MDKSKITLQDINLPHEVSNIFEVEGIYDIEQILYLLEIYRFVDRTTILALLERTYPE